MSWDKAPAASDHEMKSENDEQAVEQTSEKSEETERSLIAKLRDLRPEKDPMGAGQPIEPR